MKKVLLTLLLVAPMVQISLFGMDSKCYIKKYCGDHPDHVRIENVALNEVLDQTRPDALNCLNSLLIVFNYAILKRTSCKGQAVIKGKL